MIFFFVVNPDTKKGNVSLAEKLHFCGTYLLIPADIGKMKRVPSIEQQFSFQKAWVIFKDVAPATGLIAYSPWQIFQKMVVNWKFLECRTEVGVTIVLYNF